MSSRATRLRDFLSEESEIGPGTLVSERVRLKKRIATGGMGTVWRAEHTTLGVDVAVKLLTDDVRDDPDAITRFQNEASTASRLASAHVVKVLDFGLFAGDTPYLVMELLEGEDLATLIAREGPRSPAQVADILEQAARGLLAAHEVGFIHRDVKPQNLFLASVDGKRMVKLLDFGVARRPVAAESTTTKSGQLLGTPLYMGPEQLTRPAEIDARADLWSLSVVAYEALTGVLPFDGDTVGALAIAVDRGQFELPSKRNPRIGRGVDRWFQRAFARAPADRFQTAGELANAFRIATEEPPARKVWPFAVALVAAAGVGVVALASSRPDGEPPKTVRETPAAAKEATSAATADMTSPVDAAPSTAPAVAKETSGAASARKKPVKASTSEPARGSVSSAPVVSEKPRKDRGF